MKKKVILSVSIIILSLILILGGNALRSKLTDNNSNNVSKKITAVNQVKKKQVKDTSVKDTSKAQTKDSDAGKAANNKQATDKSKENSVSNKESSSNPNSGSSSAPSNKSASSNRIVTPAPSPKPSEEPNLTVLDTVSNRTILSTYIDVSGKTVGEVTLNALSSKGISVETTGSGYSLYISAIAGVREKEHGKNSGWIYFVNGSSPQIGCGSYKLKQGDKVTWKYSSN
ncbi:DUF4430 domain-containing protein [Clostridium neuense]|uniref:DUF4430 domain-containing protein n=1 Tax=Clostridium neuense TaxID=1728934 RepID=A0ABW8TJ51_9CLOT